MLAHVAGLKAEPWDPDRLSDYVLADLCSETETLPDFLSELVRYLDQNLSSVFEQRSART